MRYLALLAFAASTGSLKIPSTSRLHINRHSVRLDTRTDPWEGVRFVQPLDDDWGALSTFTCGVGSGAVRAGMTRMRETELEKLPLFFVKDLPLPLGLKTANIIDPRYLDLISRTDEFGLIYSDERGFASTVSRGVGGVDLVVLCHSLEILN